MQMSNKKLSVTQKQTIFQIIDNNLDPKEKIEEILANKNKLLTDIKMKSENLDNLQKKKNALNDMLEKYNFLKETRKSEYDDLLLEIEILEEELAKLVENQEVESIKSKIEKEIQEILELENNRDEYSDRFLEIRKSAIDSIKEALIKKDTQDSVQDEVNNDIEMMKTIGIEIWDEEKNNMVQEAINKAKPKAFEEIKTKEEDKEKVRYLKDLEELVNKKPKENKLKKIEEEETEAEEIENKIDPEKKVKTMDLLIDLTWKTPQIQIIRSGDEEYTKIVNDLWKIKYEEEVPANHIDSILWELTYISIFALWSILWIELGNIKKLYKLSEKWFNIKKIDEEMSFMINFFKTINDDRTMDIFSTMEKKMTLTESRSIKQAKNKIREFLQPTVRIKPILELSESMNFQNRFRKIIDEEKIPELQKLIKQNDKLIKETFDEVKEAKNNDECMDAINNNVEEYIKIYSSIRNIIISTKIKEKDKSLDDVMNEIFDYLWMWYVLWWSTIWSKDSFIAEQLLFIQLLQNNSKYIFAKDINKLRDMSEFLVWQREKIEGEKIDNNIKNSLKNLYNTILVTIDILINQAILHKKVQNIVKNNDIIEEDTEENTDKYKSLADKYFSLLPDINTIWDDNIVINNNPGIDDINKEMINPVVIKSKEEWQEDSLMLSIWNLDQLITREKTRQKIQEEYKLDTKVAEDKIKKTMYTWLGVGKFRFLIPNELDWIWTVYIHKNGEISIDWMTWYWSMEILWDLNYERFRAWVFYYLYEANCKIDKRWMWNPYEELWLSKPSSSDDLIIQHDPRYVYDANIQNSGVQRIVKYKRWFVRLLRVWRITWENAIENVNKLNSEWAEIRLFAWFFSKSSDPMIDEPIKKIEITDKSKLEILEIQNKANTWDDEFVCFDTWVSEHKKDKDSIAPVRVKVGKMIWAGDGFVKKLNEMKYTENKEKSKTEKIQKDLKDKEKNDVPEVVNEFSKKILAFFKTREIKIQWKEKVFRKDLIRLAKSALWVREFDFARYENTYEIDEEKDLIRRNIKKRAKENWRTNQQ